MSSCVCLSRHLAQLWPPRVRVMALIGSVCPQFHASFLVTLGERPGP